MELTLFNATCEDNVYSWKVSLQFYKIQSITITASEMNFYAKYNNDVEQYLESGRTDSCPAIFSGDFNAFFFDFPNVPIQDIQDIQIILIECDT